MSKTIILRLDNNENLDVQIFKVSEEHLSKLLDSLKSAVSKGELERVRIWDLAGGNQTNCSFRTLHDMEAFISHFPKECEEAPLNKKDFESIIEFSAGSIASIERYTFNKVWRVDILRLLVDLQDNSIAEGAMKIIVSEEPDGTLSCQFETEHDLSVAKAELSQYLSNA